MRHGATSWVGLLLVVTVGCGEAPLVATDAGPADLAASDSTTDSPDLTADPSDLTVPPLDLTVQPEDMAEDPPDLQAPPPDLTAPPPDLTESPSDLTAPPPDLTASPPDLTESPSDLSAPDLAAQDATSVDLGTQDPPPVPVSPNIRIEPTLRTKLDLLFMIDNSFGTDAPTAELSRRFGILMNAFQGLAQRGIFIDLHVGVVTSDLDAGATGASTCLQSPGRIGMLQALGASAPSGCRAPVGANFAAYDFANSGASNNLPLGQNLAQTFACMAAVGSSGCGFEHPLEAVHAALRAGLPENAGFLRDDAELAVMYLTNEDDCSAPLDTDLFNLGSRTYGYPSSYRCTRYGIVCSGSPPPYGNSGGSLSNCSPGGLATGGKLFDVSRYIDLFVRPASGGGLKANPFDVTLSAIDAPEAPVQVILSDPSTPPGQPYVSCPSISEATAPACVPVLEHSCRNPQASTFFGDPAVRVNHVVRSVRSQMVTSICDADFSAAMADLGRLIDRNLGAGCVAAPLSDLANPDCAVADLTALDDGSVSARGIPRCDRAGGAFPCWRLVNSAICLGASPQGVAITVERGGLPPLPATSALAECR